MHASLLRHCDDFHLYVLALSRECEDALAALEPEHVTVISLSSVEAFHPELSPAKANRSPIEYVFTLSPAWPLYLFDAFGHIDQLTYLDGDLWFFSDPSPVFSEIGDSSIAIVPHRFPEDKKSRERFGIYNVGWLTYRRDQSGLECLRWWKQKCIEWCYDRVEDGRFADQAYLDDWPDRFAGVAVIRNPGVNLAPWNIASHRLELDGTAAGQCLVDGRPLIFFHFQGMREVFPGVYDLGLMEHGAPKLKILRQNIYAPYLRELHAFERMLNRRFKNVVGAQRLTCSWKSSPAKLLKAAVNRDLMLAATGGPAGE